MDFVVRRLFARNYHEILHDWTRRTGVELHLEPYGGPFGPFEDATACDVPMVEFWNGVPRASSSFMAMVSVMLRFPFINSLRLGAGIPRVAAKSFCLMPRALSSFFNIEPGCVAVAGMICLAFVSIMIRVYFQ